MKSLIIISVYLLATQTGYAADHRCPEGAYIGCIDDSSSGDSTRTSVSTHTEVTTQWGAADPIIANPRPGAPALPPGYPGNAQKGDTRGAVAPTTLGRFDSIPEPTSARPVGAVTFSGSQGQGGGATVVIERHDDDDQH